MMSNDGVGKGALTSFALPKSWERVMTYGPTFGLTTMVTSGFGARSSARFEIRTAIFARSTRHGHTFAVTIPRGLRARFVKYPMDGEIQRVLARMKFDSNDSLANGLIIEQDECGTARPFGAALQPRSSRDT